jgi:hypothetical protein
VQTAQTRSRLFGAKGEGRESEERAPLWKIEFFLLSSLFLESEKSGSQKVVGRPATSSVWVGEHFIKLSASPYRL